MPTNKQRIVLKALIVAFGAIALGVGIYMAITMFSGVNNYFTAHFGMPIVLASVAVVALCLPVATRQKFGGDDSKDKIMMVVAVLLLLLAIFTFALSYANISFLP